MFYQVSRVDGAPETKAYGYDPRSWKGSEMDAAMDYACEFFPGFGAKYVCDVAQATIVVVTMTDTYEEVTSAFYNVGS